MINLTWMNIGILLGLIFSTFINVREVWWSYVLLISVIIFLMIMDTLEDRKKIK